MFYVVIVVTTATNDDYNFTIFTTAAVNIMPLFVNSNTIIVITC